jgi:uncharacterized protein (DUF2141 family)
MRGVVSGRVISMATGAPLAGARVVVTADELADQPLRSAITDDLGRYTIGSLPASSSIIVTAGRVGFASSAFGELPPATPPVFIELAANGRKNNVDIDLLQQVAITGHVFDEDGAPFGGAIVEALRAVYEAGRRDLIVIAGGTTDSTGAYRVFGLSPGQYIISAFDPAYAAVGDADGALYYGATYFPASLASDRAEHVTLAPGEDRDGLDLTLQLTRPARVSGILSASNLPLISGQQQPFTGGSVFMTPLLDNDLPSYSVSDAPLKPDLSFAFNNVLPGRYAIWARADTDKPSRSYFARLTLSVGGADVPGVPLALSPGCVINGAVRWVGHDGRKPPSVVATRDIRVRAPMGDGTSLGDALTGKLNADNTFSIPGVMAGDHVIRLENLPEPWHLDTVYTTDGVNMTEVPLDTSSHSHIDVIVTLTDQATEIVGHLTVERRDLLPTFNVIAFPANPVLWRPDTRRIQLVHPDAQGNYDITGLPPGDYYVVAAQDVDEGDLNNPKILDNLRGAATRDNQVVLADVTAYKVVNLQGLIRRWNDTPRPRWPR